LPFSASISEPTKPAADSASPAARLKTNLFIATLLDRRTLEEDGIDGDTRERAGGIPDARRFAARDPRAARFLLARRRRRGTIAASKRGTMR
jgi:hypothetical protein